MHRRVLVSMNKTKRNKLRQSRQPSSLPQGDPEHQESNSTDNLT